MKKSFTLSSVICGYFECRSSTNEAYLLLISCFHDVSKSFVIVFNIIKNEHTRSNVRTCLTNGLAVWEGMEMHSEQMLLAQDLVGSNNA